MKTLENILTTIQRLSHFLPTQAHIKDFVHHNTLHAVQNLPFHQGIAVAKQKYGAQDYLPLHEYRSLFEKNKITNQGIKKSLELNKNHELTEELFKVKLLSEPLMKFAVATSQPPTLRQQRDQKFHVQLDDMITPLMIRLSSHFLDQGIATQSLPHHDQSFWNFVRNLNEQSYLPMAPFNRSRCQVLLKLSFQEALTQSLHHLVAKESYYEAYLWEVLQILPGWAGFVHEVQKNPKFLKTSRLMSVEEWLAVWLLFEVGFLDQQVKKNYVPLGDYGVLMPSHLHSGSERAAAALGNQQQQSLTFIQLCHEALEWSRYLDFLQHLKHKTLVPSVAIPKAQAVFCIDDRFFSFRYFLEMQSPDVATYSGPGFFGIDCLAMSATFDHSEKQCPVPVNPRNIILQKFRKSQKTPLLFPQRRGLPVQEWLQMHFAGLPAAAGLVAETFFPEVTKQRKLQQELDFDLVIWAEEMPKNLDPQKIPQGLKLGFSYEEASERVFHFLTNIGFNKDFATVVAIVAHGASSVNNPYFAAYDCGACSGRPGALNAKAFCTMANHPEVRALLAQKGITIAASTVFVPFIFDTTANVIDQLEQPSLDAAKTKTLEDLKSSFTSALALDAAARCQKFLSVDRALTPQQATKHVQRRSLALFEPRPEYNHATNFACIVGRRYLSQGFFYGPNVFLNSYNPEVDPEGLILEKILAAVVPVCGGINLEYFFSRIDSRVYGAGSKLPQNVIGFFGVMTGFESDLRTGLPTQMVDIHEPIRLLLVIEHEPDVIARVIAKMPEATEWVSGQWLWLVCQRPHSSEQLLYYPQGDAKWTKI